MPRGFATCYRSGMTSITRHQIRAARALLALQQEALCHEADVGVASLRRFENGNEVGEDVVAAILTELERQGAVLIPAGTVVDGREVGGGVALKPWGALHADAKARLQRLNQSSTIAAAKASEPKRDGVGRRTRTPVPEEALAKREPGQRRGARRRKAVLKEP